MHVGLQIKHPLLLSAFNPELGYIDKFLQKFPILTFIGIRTAVPELSHVD